MAKSCDICKSDIGVKTYEAASELLPWYISHSYGTTDIDYCKECIKSLKAAYTEWYNSRTRKLKHTCKG